MQDLEKLSIPRMAAKVDAHGGPKRNETDVSGSDCAAIIENRRHGQRGKAQTVLGRHAGKGMIAVRTGANRTYQPLGVATPSRGGGCPGA